MTFRSRGSVSCHFCKTAEETWNVCSSHTCKRTPSGSDAGGIRSSKGPFVERINLTRADETKTNVRLRFHPTPSIVFAFFRADTISLNILSFHVSHFQQIRYVYVFPFHFRFAISLLFHSVPKSNNVSFGSVPLYIAEFR